MALMLEENTGQLARKGNPRLLTVVLHPRVFSSVTRISRARMPAATFGALVGKVTRSGAMPQVAVVEAVPMEIALAAARNRSWQSLKERLGSEGAGLELVGWFYADPGIGVFPPQVDAAEIHRALSPEARVLLLANPSTEAGGFYVLKRGKFEPVGGFYEAMTLQKPAPDITWNGEVPRGEEWLHSPGSEISNAAVGSPDEPPGEEQAAPERVPAPNGATYTSGPSEVDQLTGRTARSGRVDPLSSEESPQDQAPVEVPQRVRKALDDARAAITAMDATPGGKAPKVRRAMATRPLAQAMLPPAEEMSPPTLAPASAPSEPKQTNPLEKPIEKPAEATRLDFTAMKLLPVDAAAAAGATAQPAPEPEKKRRGIGIMVVGLVGLLGVIAIAALIGTGVLNLQSTSQATPVATVSSGGIASPTLPSGSGQPGFTATAVAGQGAAGNATKTQSPTSTSTSTPTAASSPTATATLTSVPTETPTQVPPTLTLTSSPVPPTATFTQVPPPPTFTRVPPRPTFTPRLPTPKPAYIYYTVQSGDTLSGIAYRFRTTVNAIMLANRLSSTYIYRGQVLAIPNR